MEITYSTCITSRLLLWEPISTSDPMLFIQSMWYCDCITVRRSLNPNIRSAVLKDQRKTFLSSLSPVVHVICEKVVIEGLIGHVCYLDFDHSAVRAPGTLQCTAPKGRQYSLIALVNSEELRKTAPR